jgi:hypothetical protein
LIAILILGLRAEARGKHCHRHRCVDEGHSHCTILRLLEMRLQAESSERTAGSKREQRFLKGKGALNFAVCSP